MTPPGEDSVPAPLPAPPYEAELALLAHGTAGFVGQVRDSSNVTLVLELTGEGTPDGDLAYGWGVFKPVAGEAPLHDFEPGLHRRERAAFLLSEHLGWHVVPPTVIREVEPLGEGSLQWYIENDGMHYLPLEEGHPEVRDQLRRLAVFDVLANNTDRKSGHVLWDANHHVWGIDHGLCFSADPKLRTVIWDFEGEDIDAGLLAAVEEIALSVPEDVAELLSAREVVALRRRAARLVREPVLPTLESPYQYPWPLV